MAVSDTKLQLRLLKIYSFTYLMILSLKSGGMHRPKTYLPAIKHHDFLTGWFFIYFFVVRQ